MKAFLVQDYFLGFIISTFVILIDLLLIILFGKGLLGFSKNLLFICCNLLLGRLKSFVDYINIKSHKPFLKKNFTFCTCTNGATSITVACSSAVKDHLPAFNILFYLDFFNPSKVTTKLYQGHCCTQKWHNMA